MRRRSVLPIVCALVAGCHAPVAKTAAPITESVIKSGSAATAMHTLRLRGADGKPIMAGQLQLGGKGYAIQAGEVQVPETVFQAAQAGGAMILVVPGFAPVRVEAQALAQGAVTLAPLAALGKPLAISAAGAAESGDGALKLAFGAGMLPAASQVSLASYRPELASLTTANAFQTALGQVYRSAGATVPAATSPFPAPPVQQALGVALAADQAIGADGKIMVSLDLNTLTRGWDGTGTAPWVTDPGSWTADQIANAQAALRILQTFADLDASGNPGLRAALQSQYDLTLAGTVLTFPVTTPADAVAGGFLRLTIPGSELLGARLEVTLTTPAATALPNPSTLAALNQGASPEALALAARVIASPDTTGAAAVQARTSLAPVQGTRAGTTVQGGLPLAIDPAEVGAGPAITGAQPPALVANLPGTPLDPAVIPGASTLLSNNGSALLSNNGSAVITNNGSTLASAPVPGLLSNNGSAIVATAEGELMANNGSALVPITGSQLLSNNGSALVTNSGGGGFTGYPYVPFQPELSKFKLFQIGPAVAPPDVRVSPKGVREYLWPGGLKLRAIDVRGRALTGWTATEADGSFKLGIQGQTPVVFFLEAVSVIGGIHLYSEVYAPGSQQGLVAVDSATSMLAISTLHLANFLPPETDRMQGVADGFQTDLDATNAALDTLKQSSKLFPVLTDQATLLSSDLAVAQARTSELLAAAGAFKPNAFLTDRQATYGVLDPAGAKLATTSPTTQPVYQQTYGLATAGQLAPRSLMPISLDSPF